MKKINFLFALLIGVMVTTVAFSQQKKKVSLEDVFKSNVFSPKSIGGINWMKDGRFYSALEKEGGTSKVIKVNVATGEEAGTLINGAEIGVDFSRYSLNPEESKALIASKEEGIYRRSSKAIFHVVDLESNTAQEIANGEKIMYATLSPDNDKVAFVKDNNLFYVELASDEIHQITHDGKRNEVINGAADWVYEEEFSMSKAFDWSPDGKKIAFIRFDEKEVPEFNMQVWGELYPQDYRFKYPKAGEENSKVSIHVYDLETLQTNKMDAGQEEDIYLPRIYWTGERGTLAFLRLNRLQNELELMYAGSESGTSQIILQEKSDTYVDLNYNDNLHFLEGNQGFVRTSEKDGYKHVYLHDNQGNQIRQITSGNWEVTDLIAVDGKNKKIYYVSTEVSPMERNLYVIGWDGKGKKLLTPEKGIHSINMSKDYRYFIDTFSNSETPARVTLNQASGKLIKVQEDNHDLKVRLTEYAFKPKEFFSFTTVDGTELNAYMIKPVDFDSTSTYPVLMYVYGGPGSQNVINAWGGARDFWHQHLASEGYIIVSVDNRGTGARGRDFKHATYANLGKLETQDQIAGAEYVASLPYVDASRIGIWGWSYGGYMSSLALMKGNGVFKSAIAVAPVTTWRYYDTIYTERYLQTPQMNAAGYDENSPITHVDKLKGNFLLIHGTGDDNVHFQNAVDLVDALIQADKQFETMYYPNRSHSIRGENTSWHLYSLMTDFLKRKL